MQPRTHIALPAAVLATGLALLASGCGSDSKDNKAAAPKPQQKTTAKAPAPAGNGSTLALAADPGGKIAFDKKSLTAKAGTVTIDLQNTSQVSHAIAVEGNGVDKDSKPIQGAKTSLTVKLKPGTYEFYCPVDNHKADGMKGTLTVK